MESQKDLFLDSLLCCPICKSDLIRLEKKFRCETCRKEYLIRDRIYYFNQNSQKTQSAFFRGEWYIKLITTNEKHFDFPGVSQKIDIEAIQSKVISLNGKILLDAGCGTGLSTMGLLEKGTRIIFIDNIPEALMLVQKLIKFNGFKGVAMFIVGDLTQLPFKSNCIDIIWSGGVLEHFKLIHQPYLELIRVLGHQGSLIFTVPNKFGFQRILSSIKEILYPRTDHYETGFTFSQLNGLLSNNRFSMASIDLIGYKQFFYEILLPKFPILLKYSSIIYIIYVKFMRLLVLIFNPIKFGVPWFLVNAKKY